MVLGFDDVLVDAEDLFASGWTEDLIRKFLGEEDERAQVAPRVRGGKRLWKIARVARAEQNEEFRDAFAVSVARRSLTPRQVESFIEARRIARQTMSFLRARGRAVNNH